MIVTISKLIFDIKTNDWIVKEIGEIRDVETLEIDNYKSIHDQKIVVREPGREHVYYYDEIKNVTTTNKYTRIIIK